MARRRGRGDRQDIEWEFFSFPTYFAFFAGMLVAIPLIFILGQLLFVVALFGTSFCTAHAISRWFRNRSVDKKMQRAEEDELERRALAARAANAAAGEAQSVRRRRNRRR